MDMLSKHDTFILYALLSTIMLMYSYNAHQNFQCAVWACSSAYHSFGSFLSSKRP